MLRIRVGKQHYLGRHNAGQALYPVNPQFAYEFELEERGQALTLLKSFVETVKPDCEVVLEEVLV